MFYIIFQEIQVLNNSPTIIAWCRSLVKVDEEMFSSRHPFIGHSCLCSGLQLRNERLENECLDKEVFCLYFYLKKLLKITRLLLLINWLAINNWNTPSCLCELCKIVTFWMNTAIFSHLQEHRAPAPEESFAWKPPGRSITSPVAMATTRSNISSPTNTRFSAWNGTASPFTERTSSLPLSQSPTVTLLKIDRGTSSCVVCIASAATPAGYFAH